MDEEVSCVHSTKSDQYADPLAGSITPVAPGRMRNSWYPRQHAEYLSTLSDVDPKTVVAERDFTFGMQDLKQKDVSKSAYDPVTLGPSPKARTTLLTVRMMLPEL